MAIAKTLTYQTGVVFLWLILAVVSCLDAPYPEELPLQHSLTVLAVGVALGLHWKLRFNKVAFTCIFAFLALHLVGARWLYSHVPYDRWSEMLLGVNLTEHFGWTRNHYDRFAHFSYGLLFTYPVYFLCVRRGGLGRLKWYLPVEFIMASSMVYELLEWWVAVIMSPEAAERYNGQQGDLWDAHKDMLLATLGSVICIGVIWAFEPWRKRKRDSSPQEQ